MSKEAKAYHHKWIGDEKDLRDRYEVMQEYAEKYHKEQLLLHNVVGRSEQLVCPNCKSKHIGTSTHKGFLQGYCFVCNNHWAK